MRSKVTKSLRNADINCFVAMETVILKLFGKHLRNCNRNCNHCFIDIETVIMKLFDRSVDLALFPEDTPLYPVCRAWIQNRPHDRSLGTILGRPLSPKQEEEVGMFEWLYLIAQLIIIIIIIINIMYHADKRKQSWIAIPHDHRS